MPRKDKEVDERVPFNLRGEDARLALCIQGHLEKRMGRLSAVQVARMAYRALAEKEGICAK